MALNTLNTILLGRYPNKDDGTSKPIEWMVLDLDENEGKLLLISKQGLDSKPYNTELVAVTWETSSIRRWLNSEFLRETFTAKELKLISETKVTADKTPGFDTDPGNDTDDKVFLLSGREVMHYFKSDVLRRCKPTDYAVKQGVYLDNYTDGFCSWWLRSPGIWPSHMIAVNYDGDLLQCGVAFSNIAVRPALWLYLPF